MVPSALIALFLAVACGLQLAAAESLLACFDTALAARPPTNGSVFMVAVGGATNNTACFSTTIHGYAAINGTNVVFLGKCISCMPVGFSVPSSPTCYINAGHIFGGNSNGTLCAHNIDAFVVTILAKLGYNGTAMPTTITYDVPTCCTSKYCAAKSGN